MIYIKIFSDMCSSTQAAQNYKNVCNLMKNNVYSNEFKLIENENENFTHAIIINKAMPLLGIPKENVIGLAFEPIDILKIDNEFINYAKKNISEYYLGFKNNLPLPFIEHYSYMWHEWQIDNLFSMYPKTEIMSIIVSNKEYLPGHIYRYELVKKILESDMNIHIYGNGSSQFGYDKRIKGSFNDNYPPYKDYKFTIAIENTLSNDYISEKYTNPLMFNCIPIYYGAKNVSKYFGENYGYTLINDIETDFNLIKNIYNNNELIYTEKLLEESRKELVSGYCYFPNLIKRKFL